MRETDVRELIENSQGFNGILDVSNLLGSWKTNKQFLINKILDGKLIKEVRLPEVEAEYDDEELMTVCEAIMSPVYKSTKACEFIKKNVNGFKENKVVDDCGFQLPDGIKLTRAFRYLTTNKDSLRSMQDTLSTFIQKQKITGTLCLSAHPLDFLTASDNSNNWSTCHSLKNSNRGGNLSYLTDSSTLVCYIKSIEPTEIHGIKWNNKKWRMLLHFSDDLAGIIAGKQYPMKLKGIEEIVRDQLLPVRYYSDKWDYYDKRMTGEHTNRKHRYFELPRSGLYLPQKVLIERPAKALNYNDVAWNTRTKQLFTSLMTAKTRFKIGNEVKCLCCGNQVVEDSDCVLCPQCEIKYGFEEKQYFTNCRNCGNRIDLFEETYAETADGGYLCPECAEED